MYTVDTCPHLGCRDCLYFGKECKRLKGTKLEFARPWFACCSSGMHVPCSDFVPKHPEYADLKEWTNFQDFWEVYKEAWLADTKEIPFIINGEKAIRYYVPLQKFLDGTMIENGKLMATYRSYYKKTRSGFGYILVREEIDGIPVRTEEMI